MNKLKSFKQILVTVAVTLGLSFVTSHNGLAATYTTVAGDSLYIISQVFNTTTTNLMQDNNLSSSAIYPGETLYVSAKTYTVQYGDTLYLIAKKYGITLDALRKANNIWSDSIFIGKTLTIPVSTAVDTSTQTKQTNYSASDVDLLARLITAESQGEPYNAKVAVGAVVLNRVKSGSFPNSIYGVVYQVINGYYQFTPVLNGWINKPADPDSVKAAYAALNGTDPTKGALFYFDDSITNKWLLSKPVSIVINKLIFAY